MKEQIRVQVTYQLKEGAREAFLAELMGDDFLPSVHAEDGCLQYAYFRAVADENVVVLLECWESREALSVHLGQPHMKKLAGLRASYIEDTQIQLLTPSEEGLPKPK